MDEQEKGDRKMNDDEIKNEDETKELV